MMERALKERIIGAAVLVLVVVLVVPVFLDGPPGHEEIVSTSVPLPGQAEQKTQTVVLERDRTDPVPAATSSAPEPQRPQPQPVARQPSSAPTVQQPVPEPVVTQDQAAAPAGSSTTGMWAVQLGSFGSQENADRLAAELRKKNFMASVSRMTTSTGERHRVRVGPQKDRASADAMAARLKEAGYDGKVMPHP